MAQLGAPVVYNGLEIGFNADIQPAPTVTSVAPKSGSFKGGTKVTITGTDFTRVGAVTFSSAPAKSFTVDSETQITAVVATGTAKPGALAVAVTTVAGTSPANVAATFTATACVVPKLKTKSLKAAKKKLKKAGCKAGKVSKRDVVTARTGKVVAQAKGAGKKLAPGTKVNLTLG